MNTDAKNESKLFLVNIHWFIDGVRGSVSEKRFFGEDAIVITSRKDEIDQIAELTVESMGQGGTTTSFHCIDMEKDEFSHSPKFVSKYWGYDNVLNFGIVKTTILKEFTMLEYAEEKCGAAIEEAVRKRAYYYK